MFLISTALEELAISIKIYAACAFQIQVNLYYYIHEAIWETMAETKLGR